MAKTNFDKKRADAMKAIQIARAKAAEQAKKDAQKAQNIENDAKTE